MFVLSLFDDYYLSASQVFDLISRLSSHVHTFKQQSVAVAMHPAVKVGSH
jgi:hypothetical protein